MAIIYNIDKVLYINITNKCSCSCDFCIRKNGDSVRDSGSLWFENGVPPTADEIICEFDKVDLSKYDEVVFCGYGEPTEEFDILRDVAKHIKSVTSLPVRLNTNGLSDLICGREHTAFELKGLFDTVSISMNEPDAQSYLDITHSKFGIKSFDAMLDFALDARKVFKEVIFTVVDVIGEEKIRQCRRIAGEMDIPLRVRGYVKQY